jgi:hypothetical protein
MMAYACHRGYVGSLNGIVVQACPDINVRSYLNNNESKKDRRHGSSSSVPV